MQRPARGCASREKRRPPRPLAAKPPGSAPQPVSVTGEASEAGGKTRSAACSA